MLSVLSVNHPSAPTILPAPENASLSPASFPLSEHNALHPLNYSAARRPQLSHSILCGSETEPEPMGSWTTRIGKLRHTARLVLPHPRDGAASACASYHDPVLFAASKNHQPPAAKGLTVGADTEHHPDDIRRFGDPRGTGTGKRVRNLGRSPCPSNGVRASMPFRVPGAPTAAVGKCVLFRGPASSVAVLGGG